MKPLVITDPLTIGPDQLLATDVPDGDYPDWDSNTNYGLAERVVRGITIYESAQSPNMGNDPATSSEAWWLKVGPINRWRAFEPNHTTATAKPGGFFFELRPGYAISAIHVTDMVDCATLRITLTDPIAGVVWDTGVIAVGRVITLASWWQWCFGKRIAVTQKHWYGIPTWPQAVLRIEVTGGNNCAIGTVMVGQTVEFGLGVRSGLRLSIDDFSRKERDQWGEVTLREGAYIQRVPLQLTLANSELDALHDFLSRNRARILFWQASDRWNSTGLIGFYRSWEIQISYAMYSDVSIEIEGMTQL